MGPGNIPSKRWQGLKDAKGVGTGIRDTSEPSDTIAKRNLKVGCITLRGFSTTAEVEAPACDTLCVVRNRP